MKRMGRYVGYPRQGFGGGFRVENQGSIHRLIERQKHEVWLLRHRDIGLRRPTLSSTIVIAEMVVWLLVWALGGFVWDFWQMLFPFLYVLFSSYLPPWH